ncbi:MAG: cytidylate kinase-like family protein [Bacteroidales bacterium]
MNTTLTPSTYRYRSNLLQEYFNKVMQSKEQGRCADETTAPYISISRDFGAMANPVASKLAKELTRKCRQKNIPATWNWLNREILEESSKALDLPPSQIEYIFRSRKKTMMDEVVAALQTRYYKNDRVIRKTVRQVLCNVCRRGHVIIVGRGGVAFAAENPDSLHIKLTAPLDWRIRRVSKNYGLTADEARDYINRIDRERKGLIDDFLGYKSDISVFDLVFNRATLSEDEIISIIINLAAKKGLIR